MIHSEKMNSEESGVQEICEALRNIEEFPQLQSQDIARIVTTASRLQLTDDQMLCKVNENAERVFLLVSGALLGADQKYSAPRLLGIEPMVGLKRRVESLRASGNAFILAIPRNNMPRVSQDRGWQRYLEKFTGSDQEPESCKQTRGTVTAKHNVKIWGWLPAIGLPVMIYLLGPSASLDWRQMNYLSMLSVCLVMMIFHLAPQYAAAMIATLGCLLLDVAPPSVILGGFASGGFFMALSILGLGVVLVRSGLVVRIYLQLLKRTPRNNFAYNLVTLLLGVVMTPCLPSANARIALLSPLTISTLRTLGYRKGGPEATRLFLSMFVGASMFAPFFLTSKSLNFVIYDLLPQQVSMEYQWWQWFLYSTGFILFLGLAFVGITAIVFHGNEKPTEERLDFEERLLLLGKMGFDEYLVMWGMILFIGSIISYPIHKISPFWISLGLLCFLMLLSLLKSRNFSNDFDWGVLLLIGFFIGLEDTMGHIGIEARLTVWLEPVTRIMVENFHIFTLIMAGVVGVVRLFLPITTAGVLIASVFLPLAYYHGVNPWVVGFVILNHCESWALPYQCSYYLTLRDECGQPLAYDQRLFLRINLYMMVLRFIGLFLAIEMFRFWEVI